MKCRVTTKGTRFCKSMERALADTVYNERKKGLIAIQTTNVRTSKTLVIGVAHKLSPHDKGTMFNLCPWCGGSLQGWQKVVS